MCTATTGSRWTCSATPPTASSTSPTRWDSTTARTCRPLAAAIAQHGREHRDCIEGCAAYVPQLDLDPESAMYVLSVLRLEPGHDRSMPRWQKALYRQLDRASAQRTAVLHLPTTRTVVMGAETELQAGVSPRGPRGGCRDSRGRARRRRRCPR